MNVYIKNKKLLNYLKLIGINTWIAENENFDEIVVFSVKEKNYIKFIKYLENFNIDFTINTSFKKNYLPIVDLIDNKLIIEDDENIIDDILVISLTIDNHKKLLNTLKILTV